MLLLFKNWMSHESLLGVSWVIHKGKSYFIDMVPHNAKIQFDYVEKGLKCKTSHFEKFLEKKIIGGLSWNEIPWKKISLLCRMQNIPNIKNI